MPSYLPVWRKMEKNLKQDISNEQDLDKKKILLMHLNDVKIGRLKEELMHTYFFLVITLMILVGLLVTNNLSIRCESGNGHLDVVKYLHESGADLTADN